MELEANTTFTEIELPESVEERRKLLCRYNGRFILVKDKHLPLKYTLIKLNYSGEDPNVYHTIDQKRFLYGKEHFHFSDLEGLIVQI